MRREVIGIKGSSLYFRWERRDNNARPTDRTDAVRRYRGRGSGTVRPTIMEHPAVITSKDASSKILGLDNDVKRMYHEEQEISRKALAHEAVEAASQGDFFLLSFLEVAEEDAALEAVAAESQRVLDKLVNEDLLIIPSRGNAFSGAARPFHISRTVRSALA